MFYFTAVSKKVIPAIEGFFTMDPEAPRLLGTQCKACQTYFFPPERGYCRNPECDSEELETVELSHEGTLWSYSHNGYKPPPPYVSPTEEFEPFAVAAVELEREKMVVMGMVPKPYTHEDLKVGQRMQLVLDPLYETDEERVMVWKWRPVEGGGSK
ncbi:MAG: benzoylsuccinyl-CoA thiolase [Sandaracinaceae bacterium]|nr:benzoylsuccinyl-CoA thiolase [Sandaracinaceae bacterium]